MADGTALEKRVETLLSEAGLQPRRRETVEGARQADEFDLVFDVTALGIGGICVVECKDWARNVDKGTVLTFINRVANTGADQGVIVTTTGYQSGCWDAIEHTNVRLLTTDQFEEFIGEEVARAKLRSAKPRASALIADLESMHRYGTRLPESPFRQGMAEHFPSGPLSHLYSERLQALRVLLAQVTEVLAGDNHYRLPVLAYDEDLADQAPDDWYPTVQVDDIRTFAHVATTYVNDWETWTRNLIPPP